MQELGSRKSYFISDIHLQRNWGRNGEILLRFFDGLIADKHTPSSLFLVGDIFDVWVSNHSFFRKSFSPFVEKIEQLAKLMPVYYLEGNHDFHVKKFWQPLGVEVVSDDANFTCQGLKLRVEHGDFINPEDKAYLKWRQTARGPLFTFLAHNIPGRIWQWIAENWIGTNKKLRQINPLDSEERVRSMIRAYAQNLTADFDLLVAGHMHVRDEFQFDSDAGPRRSVNLGTWLKQPCVYVLEDGVGQFFDLELD